jgi:hypothetical protein
MRLGLGRQWHPVFLLLRNLRPTVGLASAAKDGCDRPNADRLVLAHAGADHGLVWRLADWLHGQMG